MSNLPVNLEISRLEIRGVFCRSGLAGKSFAGAAQVSIKGDVPVEQQAVAFVQEKFPGCSGIYLNAPYESVFLRELLLPFTEKAKIRDVLPFELESQLPFGLDEIVYDSQFYVSEGSTKVIVAGTRREVLIPLIQAFRTAGIAILGIYIPADAFYQFFLATGSPPGLLLHLGRSFSLLIDADVSLWRTARVLPFGHEKIVHELSRLLKKPYAEARELFDRLSAFNLAELDDDTLKKHVNLNRNQIKIVNQVMANFGSQLGRDLVLQHAAQSDDDKNRPLYFSCDRSESLLLQSMVATHAGQPVQLFPYERTALAMFDRDMVIPVAAAYSVGSKKGFNLLQGSLKKDAKVTSVPGRKRWWALAALAGILFAISFVLDFRYRGRFLQEREKEREIIFQKYFNRKPATDNPLSEAMDILARERKKTEIFRKFFSSEKFSQTLVSLHQSLPMGLGLEIESISYDAKAIDLAASAPSFAALNEIKDSLKKSGKFAGVESTREKSMPSGQGNRIKFNLIIKPLDDKAG